MGFNPCDTCTADDAETEGDSCEDCEFTNARAEYDAAEATLYKIQELVDDCLKSPLCVQVIYDVQKILKEWGVLSEIETDACLECGHGWVKENDDQECPFCHASALEDELAALRSRADDAGRVERVARAICESKNTDCPRAGNGNFSTCPSCKKEWSLWRGLAGDLLAAADGTARAGKE